MPDWRELFSKHGLYLLLLWSIVAVAISYEEGFEVGVVITAALLMIAGQAVIVFWGLLRVFKKIADLQPWAVFAIVALSGYSAWLYFSGEIQLLTIHWGVSTLVGTGVAILVGRRL